MNMKAKLEAEAASADTFIEQLAKASGRPLHEFTHAYTVERLILSEHYIGILVNMLAQFHPYLQPELQSMADNYNKQMTDINERHPIAGLMLPPGVMRQ